MDGIELEHLDGSTTWELLKEIQTVYAEAFPQYDLGDHEWRTAQQTKSEGFETVTAREDGALIGFVYGLPLPPRTTWWNGLMPSGPPGFATETGHRTFAVIDLAVLPRNRGRGLGRSLIRELLRSRAEERATLTVSPREPGLQQMYEKWGWRKIGQTQGGEGATESVFDVYVISLR